MLKVASKQTTEEEEIRALAIRFVDNHIKRLKKKMEKDQQKKSIPPKDISG